MNGGVKGSCRDARPSLEHAGVKLGLSLAMCGALAAFGGCSVGSGSGSIDRTSLRRQLRQRRELRDRQRLRGRARPLQTSPRPSSPAAPVDDLMRGPGAMNKLYIELASSGLLQRYTDGLEFLVQNSYEVARCVRGRTVNGQPDYLVNAPLPLTLATASNPDADDALVRLDGNGLQRRRRARCRHSRRSGRWHLLGRRHVDDGVGAADPSDTVHRHPPVALAVPHLPEREQRGQRNRRLDPVSELRRRGRDRPSAGPARTRFFRIS